MARVELSKGGWAELRDQITGGDRRAARAAVQVTVRSDEARVVSAELEDNVMYALLARLITGWSLAQPLPGQALVPADVLDALDLDDQEALYLAVRPTYERIMTGGPKKETKAISGRVLSTGSSEGQEPGSPSTTE